MIYLGLSKNRVPFNWPLMIDQQGFWVPYFQTGPNGMKWEDQVNIWMLRKPGFDGKISCTHYLED